MSVGIGEAAIAFLHYCYVHPYMCPPPTTCLLSKLSPLDLTVAHNVDGSNILVIELGANLILFGKILLQALNQN